MVKPSALGRRYLFIYFGVVDGAFFFFGCNFFIMNFALGFAIQA